MKRLITCAALLLFGGVTALALAELERSMARADEGAAPSFGHVDPASGTPGRSDALREAYIEQLRAKAALMSDDEVKAALNQTAKEVRELEAKQQVQEISEALATVAEKYEGTQAAAVAEQMVQMYRNGGGYGGNAPYYAPTPTPSAPTPSTVPTF